MMAYCYKVIDSPVGALTLAASDKGLAAILWGTENPKWIGLTPIEEHDSHPVLLETERQLGEYFAGRLQKFSLPLHFTGTEFQKKVWNALVGIPFGETRSYGQIASQIGNPKAVRAVGAANGKNPISIVAACHRVIGADGSLTGFGGGLDIKAFLLNLEARQVESGTEFFGERA